jgi:hypothetical protein
MQAQPQLPRMDAHRTIVKRAVVNWLPENRVANFVLGQLAATALKGLLGEIKQEFAQTGRFLKPWTGSNTLDNLPPLIFRQGVLWVG